VWSGEYGWFGDPARDEAQIAEYARQEDAHRWGGAWWQWRQSCGDPHQFAGPSGPPVSLSPSLNRYACPSMTPLGIPDSTRRILSRAYPRAAPGGLTSLVSDPATGRIRTKGPGPSVRGSCTLDLWMPSPGPGLRPTVAGINVTGLAARPSAGGWRVTGCAHGEWTVSSGAPAPMPAARRCPRGREPRRGRYAARRCSRYRGR
jgi:endoglycosylceramidase